MNDAARRPAAVVLGIITEAPHGVIFIERAPHLRHHAGQIGLPGGGSDPEDAGDLRRTALREMEEEVGVESDRVKILAELPIVRARVNNYAVTPFVAAVKPGPLRIDAGETVGVFTVPLETVVRDLQDGTVNVGAIAVVTPVLMYGERRIWGLTGFILRTFVDAWNDESDPLRELVLTELRA
ncbi:MAG TPA: CoA pyrophosphatase [Candidatus Baltobacteraceae bacterium]|nr:CoA pyrophosphatase [Candidatus Baltobacteraceae bacterium]